MPSFAVGSLTKLTLPQERIVCLNGEINGYLSASIVAQLLWLESDAPEKPITMYINSPGGSVTSGGSRHQAMALCARKCRSRLAQEWRYMTP